LQRQPENQYDVNAVQVLLPGFSKEGTHAHIWQQFANDALDDPDLQARLQDPFFLGFVCNSEKTGGKMADPIAKIMDDAGIMQIAAWLTFNAKGFPMVETDCQPVEADPTGPDCDPAPDDEFDPPQLDRDRFPQDS
jgi:hypothetical protein